MANIDKLPELASDNAIIEEMTQKLESLKSAYAEKKLNISTENSICIGKIVAKQRRKFEEPVKGCKQVAAHSKTIETNEETRNKKVKELNRTRAFAWGFRTIGICEDNKSCALEDPNVLTQGTLMDSFKEGVEQGVPNEKDPLSYLFNLDLRLMTHYHMKNMFRYLQNIGWDLSLSFSEKKIYVDKIKSNIYDQCKGETKRKNETVQETNLRLQHTMFGDRLTEIGQFMMKKLQAAELKAEEKAKQAAKFKAEEQAKEQKKLAALPSSTQKRLWMKCVLLQVIG